MCGSRDGKQSDKARNHSHQHQFGLLTPLSTIFQFLYIVAVSFIGEENHRPAASH
jgi:hypothetical protein